MEIRPAGAEQLHAADGHVETYSHFSQFCDRPYKSHHIQ
jgi:hypothetical protein